VVFINRRQNGSNGRGGLTDIQAAFAFTRYFLHPSHIRRNRKRLFAPCKFRRRRNQCKGMGELRRANPPARQRIFQRSRKCCIDIRGNRQAVSFRYGNRLKKVKDNQFFFEFLC
jgi:hypothetical protein